jgi:Flp pilus assembly protein TadD
MRVRLWLAGLLLLGLVVPAAAQDQRPDRERAKEHVDWGIDLAKVGLWQDATNQFQQAVKVDPTYAEAWNDLAIGYEQLGKLEDARDAYDEALQLEPNNQFIRNNYDQFRQIYDRQNIRRGGG